MGNVPFINHQSFTTEKRMAGIRCDILVAGGGLGGCAAALAAAEMGCSVVLSEETAWIGGQVTSQGVSAPDEHRYIEQFGCTARYRALREGVRAYYRSHYPLTAAGRAERHLNPGGGRVSRLCHEPRVALAVLHALLAPHVAAGRVTLLTRWRPVAAEASGDRVGAVQFRDLESGAELTVEASLVLDATELGDLLPLAGVEYVSGTEARAETGEPHAAERADPENVQAVTSCFALEYRPGEDHTIGKPWDYARWRDEQPLSWTYANPRTLQPVTATLFPEPGDARFPLWLYRRILDQERFLPGAFASDVSLINWPQNDYWGGNLIDKPEEEFQRHVEAAKRVSLSLLYWLQTEAPRPDGGTGYAGLRLRPDVMGTADGLAMYPYIRESRRIRALFTVVEQHLAPEYHPDGLGEPFPDSVGIGLYRIDLHPSTGGDNYIDVGCCPFRIPLGALIPARVDNLLAANKNIGSTHITNGAYRLHPVEWNIGEAAGALAAFCLEQGVLPRQVRAEPERLRAFQALLAEQGVELNWPEIGPV